ncbi:hypothetical protein DPMN_112953 [Dreissena polymorpha]|uniref:Uncharacterized protein n=1 Tax=Dreissena polymorpha TaxID=45954 RepID=A0A9D4QR49_DREPO|nr:hypothetical protein DPMN_112953 [Dreissena polymorpha]
MPVTSRQSAGLPMYRSFTGTLPVFNGLHRDNTGDNRGVAVALPGSIWAPVELRRRSGCSRCRPGCCWCRAGRCRSFPIHLGGIKHFNTFPVVRLFPVVSGSFRASTVEPWFIPVEPRFIPVDPGPGLHRHRSATGPLAS